MTASSLQPDREQIERFVDALFKHAQPGTYVSLRSFYDEASGESFDIRCISVDDRERVVAEAYRCAQRAANAAPKIVFCPPTATFSNTKHAGKADVADGLELSAECDQRPQAARATLEKLLGPATIVVASGGEWTDPETGEVEPKLHLHWRLKQPARGDDRALLEQARKLVIEIVGSDPFHAPISHPIRWPGSVHRKGEPKLCRIIDQNDCEIDLSTALAVLQAARPAASEKSYSANGGEQTGTPNWGELIGEVLTSESYHVPLARLASKLLVGGTNDGTAVNLLRGLMEAAAGPRDARWQARFDDIPRAVSTAREKFAKQKQPDQLDAFGAKLVAQLLAGHAARRPPVIPVDLWNKFDPPTLPTGLLPPAIEQFAIAKSEMMGCDAGGLAMSALAVCAAAIPDRIELQVKRHDRSWKEPARLWVALIGGPSTKKSPVMKEAAMPLVRLDAELYREYARATAQYVALAAQDKKTTTPPKQKRLRMEDTTIEAAQVVLEDSPDGVLCWQDELSGWFGSMDKYSGARGGMKDRGFWLQSWNGGTYAFNRVGRGVGIIPNLSISVLGGIQPEPLRKVMADAVDDGLIQRLFPIVLPDATMGRDEPELNVVGEYEELIIKLHKLEPPANYGEGNLAGLLINVLRFDEQAQDLRAQLEQQHIDLQTCGAISRKLAAHIGKYDGLFARLCVIWHCIENVDQQNLPRVISDDIAQRVAKFLHKYLLPHAVAFYAGVLGLSDDHERLTAVAGFILSRKLERITNRDVQHGDRTMRKLAKRDIENIFEQLDALGWIDRVPAPRPSDPPHWIVNPEVHRRFRERAEIEAKRRAEARAIIKDLLG